MLRGKWAVTLLAACATMLLLAGCPKSFSLLVLSQGPGSAVWDPSGNAHTAGTVITVTAVPTAGAHFDHWSGGLTGNANPATVTLTADLSVTAVFAPNTFTLAYTAADGGSITGETPQTVLYGGSGAPVSADATAGHHFVRWSDGSTVNPRTDSSVTVDVNVSAEFASDTFTLSYTAGDHGAIVDATPQTVAYGADGTEVTAVPAEHCHFVQWSDGVLTAARTDRAITADLNVMALFAVDTFTLAYDAGEHGAITGATAQTVDYGTDGTEVTAVPAEHCHFVQWSDGVPTAVRTDSNVTANLSVTAEFDVDTRTLAYTAEEHGGIAGQARQTVDYGMAGTQVIAVPETGYHFVQWSDGLLTPARRDTGGVTDISVTASFAINVYTLTYTAGEKGVLFGAASQTVNHGSDGTSVTALPNEGCHFVQWSDGVITATRTDANVTGNITVVAEFGSGIVIHVDADSTAVAPDGATWATAYADLQTAVDAAPYNAQVWVAEGKYTSVEGAVLNMRAAVLVYGGYAGTEVYRDQRDWNAHKSVIDGQDARRCVVGADYAALDGFTVTHGKADNGGGMMNGNASPVVERCVFAANSAANDGGGMYNSTASPIITGCEFVANSTDRNGGGIYVDNQSSPAIANCLFRKNSAESETNGGFGGAVYNEGGFLELMTDCILTDNSAVYGGALASFSSSSFDVTNCVFTANKARYSGGGVLNYNGSWTMTNCVLARNSAQDGGAYFSVGSPRLTNCVFTMNTATFGGGALVASGNSLTAVNCTFFQNAAAMGSALYGADSASQRLTGCIVWDNSASEIFEDYYYIFASVDHSCIHGGFSGAGNIDADPLFVDGENGSFFLQPGSPCLDTGTTEIAPATDLLGRTRPEGAGVDMGAYEGAVTDLVTLTVQASPAQGGETIPSAGKHQYPRGARVLLAAMPSGMRFTGWTGDNTDITTVTSILMDTDKVATAQFARNAVYVAPAGKGIPDGTSWATAYHDIQPAIDVAPGDHSGEVWVAEGNYTATVDQVMAMHRGILVYGGFAGNEDSRDQRDWNAHKSVLDGGNTRRCVTGADNALLDGFTITRGTAVNGGGMANDNASPMVRNCTFVSNAAGNGGGVWNNGPDAVPTIINCNFVDNKADNGGGMYHLNASPHVEHCIFTRNTATDGGGIFEQGGSAPTSDCSFVDNSAAEGGGIYSLAIDLSLYRCVFVQNSATTGCGAGLYDESQYGRLVNCVFVRNSAIGTRGYGGGMRPSSIMRTTLTNCTFTQNIALAGGAMGGDNQGGQYYLLPSLNNCILWGDKALWGSPEVYNPSDNQIAFIDVKYCCIQGQVVGEGNISADPLFIDGPGGSVQLRSGSPCLDTGTAMGAPLDDLLGRPRPAGVGVDMGAYEGAAVPANFVTLTVQVFPAEGGHTQPPAGTHTFVRGDTAWIRAFPQGMRFTGWTGDSTEDSQDLALIMDADKTVTAEFVPNILYVNAAQIGPADVRSWRTAFSTIQEALSTAGTDSGGEVWVAGGTYTPPVNTGLML